LLLGSNGGEGQNGAAQESGADQPDRSRPGKA
jgi:hypothetical protein